VMPALSQRAPDPVTSKTVKARYADVHLQIEQHQKTLASADALIAEARKMDGDITALTGLGGRYQSAVRLAESSGPNPEATAVINRLRALAENALNQGNVAAATSAVGDLDATAQEVAEDITWVIVSKGKSGAWRFPNKKKSAKNYYLIVDAKRSNGDTVPLRITDEETGDTKVTSRFGVRVSRAIYEAVKADKMDNGLIEKNQVAHKARGSLDYTPILPFQPGRITSW